MYSIKNKCVKNSYVYSLLWFIADKYHHLAGFYSMVDTFIATNNFMKEKLIEYGYKNVVVIPTFTKRIDIVINYRNKKKQICFIGRITNYKGIDLLVSAFSRVINIHSDAKLIIVGRDQEGYFSKKTHLKNIEYIGIQKSSVVRKVLSESLYTVLPVKWYENLPNVIIESFSTGTPVISTNIGSISEMIKDGITGYLTQYNSVEDLYLKIINALGISEEKYKAMQYNCIREFNNIYCSEKHYLRLMELAKSVIERQIQ